MTVFVCGEEPEDIFCGIYDAWMSRLGHEHVRLEPEGCSRELFCQYREVEVSAEKAEKVTDSIRGKLSEELYETVYRAAISRDPFRCDKIYRFLIYAFAAGPAVMERLQVPEVHQIFSMNRHLGREYDHMLGFTRFSQTAEGILIAKIEPENDITVLLAPHFADRMPLERWMIYDCRRKKAAVHQAGGPWVMVRGDSLEWEKYLHAGTDERQYETLWRAFHQAIAIPSRENPVCQRNLLPLRYRTYMTEFQQSRSITR